MESNPPPAASLFVLLRNAALLIGLAVGLGGAVWVLGMPQKASRPLAVVDPEVKNAAKAVDAAFEADWAAKGLTPVAKADSLTLARRLSLALTGSIPSLEELRAAEAVREGDFASLWLERLLSDRRSSDYLAERLTRVLVGTENGPFLIYRRRRLVEWLSEALMKNRPYDQIVRELITANGMWTTNPAVNFISVTNENKKGPDEVKLAARVSRAFLATRIDCVQCHDGKLGSAWKQTDFHQLAAFFGQAGFALNGLRDDPKSRYQNRYLGETKEHAIAAQVPWRPDLLPQKGSPRQQLATWITAGENHAFSRAIVNRMWALLLNRPLIMPVDDISHTGPWHPGLEVLAQDFAAHGYDLRRLIRVIASTRVFQMRSDSGDPAHPVTALAEQSWAAFPVTRLRPEQMAGSVIQAASLTTLDADTHVLFRLKRDADIANFVKRYGDTGEDDFTDGGGTIPQRLLLMNGNMVTDNVRDNPLLNAPSRIRLLAPDTRRAVEAAFLAVFTRRPTAAESAHFESLLAAAAGAQVRDNIMSDLFWTLMNATEFSWNH